MLKLSTLTVATTLLLSAEFNLENYVKNDLVRNPNVKVESVKILEKRDIKNHPDWKIYMFVMSLNVKGKKDRYPETIFVNEKEGLTSMSLYDFKNHQPIGKDIRPKVTDAYYQDSHLIAGNKDAKHKIVVFSDPQCPFCIQNVPGIYKDVKAHPDKFALYYYHMPLIRIHPVSNTLTKVMEVLQKEGKIDDAMKMYKLKISPSERNEDKILAEVKKQLNIDVKKEDINKPEIKEQIKKDMNMGIDVMLKGTPTVYVDGKFDPDVTSYKKFLKK
jgi:protein-disulfide isomerase